MPLTELLFAGAERIASGLMGDLRWSQDSQGRWIRQNVSQAHRTTIRQRVERRIGRTLAGREVGELGRIIDAADNATRQAHKLNRQPGRLPRHSEVQRLPGTGQRGGEVYSYTTVVTMVDRRTGEEWTTTHVVRDSQIRPGEEIAATVISDVARGAISPRGGTNPPKTGGVFVRSVDIISVYRGLPEV